MAESTLSVSINSLRREIGTFLGWGRDPTAWTSTYITDGDDIIARGLRMFYFPPVAEGQQVPYYEWSFLRTTGTVTLLTGDADYDLADDFGGTLVPKTTTWASGTDRRPIQLVSEDTIRKHQAYNSTAGMPQYLAVRGKTFVPANGQRWEALVYPAPSAAYNNTVLSFRYVSVPDTLTNTNIYPRGGAQYSETILSAVMAAAEIKQDDDPNGPFMQKFQASLQNSIRADEAMKAMYGGKDTQKQ
jgi:hypothetical protein